MPNNNVQYRRLLEPLQEQIGNCVTSADLPLPETINLNPMHTLDDTLNINTDSISLPQQIRSRFSTPEPISDKNNNKNGGHGLLLNQLFKNKSPPKSGKLNESINQSFNESEYEYETVSTNPGHVQKQNQPIQILRHQYRNNLDDTFSTQDSIDPAKPSCIGKKTLYCLANTVKPILNC